jgi:uroporphyrinogen-III synthase
VQLIVTRPSEQADEWVARLRGAGVVAQALPLITIAPPADAAPLHAAWAALAQQRLVMFVSANAVAAFFVAQPLGATWPAQSLAGATGPGTSAALRAHGVPPGCIVEPPRDAAQFDSEALWHELQARDWCGASALIVRGEGGRDWLAERLIERGARVAFVEAYRRIVPRLDAAGRALLDAAQARPQQFVWLFSSSQAIDHLRLLAPRADWSHARAIATHPRIAQRAATLGFGAVIEAAPDLDAIVAAWTRSIQSPAAE